MGGLDITSGHQNCPVLVLVMLLAGPTLCPWFVLVGKQQHRAGLFRAVLCQLHTAPPWSAGGLSFPVSLNLKAHFGSSSEISAPGWSPFYILPCPEWPKNFFVNHVLFRLVKGLWLLRALLRILFTESLRLERTSKTIKSNFRPVVTSSTSTWFFNFSRDCDFTIPCTACCNDLQSFP